MISFWRCGTYQVSHSNHAMATASWHACRPQSGPPSRCCLEPRVASSEGRPKNSFQRSSSGRGVLPAIRAWKRDGNPEVGFWLWTGEVDLAWEVDIECKSDWVPHGLMGECLHTSLLQSHAALKVACTLA